MKAAMTSTTTEARIHEALPTAQRILDNGINPDATCDWFENGVPNYPTIDDDRISIAQLNEFGDEMRECVVQFYWIGLVVGLHLNPAMFLNGGAR